MRINNCTVTLINNTITNNRCTSTYSATSGGGLGVYGSGIYAGINNIVCDNFANTNPEIAGTVNFNYSCCPLTLSGVGNITDDPLFVNPIADNYNLQAGSPCIDAGNPNSPLDPDGTRADMGALYYDQGGSYPEFDVDLTYVSGSPVPAAGGNIYFDIWVQYNGATAIDYDAWLAVEYEGGAPTTVVLRPLTNFQPGWAINRPNTSFPVPAAWAAGNYEHYARVGDEPTTVWQEDSFPWVKSGTFDGKAFQPYPVAGAENPFDYIDKSGARQPVETALFKAYPNPFNPTTVISYTLQVASYTSLSVYDLQGREVARLVDGYRDAGLHEVTFNAAHLASGVYIYRITSGSYQVAGKLTLLK